MSSQSPISIIPTDGIVDYASEYLKITDEQTIIESAKHFATLRRQYIKEIFDNWDDVVENMTLENATKVLNEFLSPKCTLLEFEFNNLTEAGKNDKEKSKNDEPTLEELNKLWQKHILGCVITEDSTKSITIPAPSVELKLPKVLTKQLDDNSIVTKTKRSSFKDIKSSVEPQVRQIEIFEVHNRVKWFIDTVNINLLKTSKKTKRTIREKIEQYRDSYAKTYNAVQVLVYLEILEAEKRNVARTTIAVFQKLTRLLQESELSRSTCDLLICANMFIQKFRYDDDEESLMRTGFRYLNQKMQMVRNGTGSDSLRPFVLEVATSLAGEEYQINQLYNLFLTVNDFSAY